MGLVGGAIAAFGVTVCAVSAKVVTGYSFPHHYLLFVLLGDSYCVCFFVWLLRRLKKQQSAEQIANQRKSD